MGSLLADRALPLNEAERRRELRAFLMSRRARLRPSDVGLPQTARRRTPGLRREEVASLAGVSTKWYTLFESATEQRVSTETVEAVGQALRLSAPEMRHLRVLSQEVRKLRINVADLEAPALDPISIAIADAYEDMAIVATARFDVYYANRLARSILGEFDAPAGSLSRNLLHRLAVDAALRAKVVEPDALVKTLAAVTRTIYCANAGNSNFNTLIDDLLVSSPAFRHTWLSHDVDGIQSPRALSVRVREEIFHFTMRMMSPSVSMESGQLCCFYIPDTQTRNSALYQRMAKSAVTQR